MNSAARPGLMIGLILVAVCMAYGTALQAGFIWDDDDYVTHNPELRSFEGLYRIWFEPRSTPQYYPMVFTSFWIEYRLWGLDPFGYHLVNILLHGLNAVMVGLVLRRLSVPGAWLAAAMFALHPVHVESVAWITERKNVLSGFFYLAALLAYFSEKKTAHALRRPWMAKCRIRQGCQEFGSLALFVCALLSKSVTCTLPVVILILLWWQRGRVTRSEAWALAPMFAAALAMGLVTTWIEKEHVGAQGEDWAFSFLERCLIAGRSIWFYMWKLAWPTDLAFFYHRWTVDSGDWRQYLYPLAAAASVGVLWGCRHRIGRGPSAAALYFVVTLSPALGFIDFAPTRFSFVADHFQYLASLGLIVPAAVMLEGRSRLASGVLLIALGILTFHQGRVYKNLETLWRDTVSKTPDSWMPIESLGIVLGEKGQTDEAIALFTKVLQLKPNRANSHCNLGLCLAKKGRTEEALAHYGEALRLDPNHLETHYNLAMALSDLGRADEAIRHYSESIRIWPDHLNSHVNLGVIYARQGNLDAAIRHFSEALRIHPGHPDAIHNLRNARVLREKNR